MARAASLERRETRRHIMISGGLAGAAILGSAFVTNERALFIPLSAPNISMTAQAFAAMFTPSALLPGRRASDAIVPIEPFDVTADSRDLRRRLMEAFGNFVAPADGDQANLGQFGSPALSPVELASAGGPEPEAIGSSAPDGGSAAPGSGTTPSGPSNTIPPLNSPTTSGITPSDLPTTPATPPSTAVPEPSVWMMLFAGFGLIGYALRIGRRDAGIGLRAAREA